MAGSSSSKCSYRCGSWQGLPINFMQTLLSCGQICKFHKAVASWDSGKKAEKQNDKDVQVHLGLKRRKCFYFSFFLFVKTRSHYVALAVLELTI